VGFRKSIGGLTALVELDVKVRVFDPVLFVFLNKARNRINVLYWERNGFCLCSPAFKCYMRNGRKRPRLCENLWCDQTG